jgi:large conductance mechanosensitive channel
VKGFKHFLMQGELVVIAVGLVVALAFSTLISSFTTNIITPLVNALEGGSSASQGLGFTVHHQFVSIGAFIAAIVYFVIFIAVIYFVIVVPYRSYMAKLGTTVYGPPAPAPDLKTCPECLSADLPAKATKCLHCGSVQPST